MRAKFAILAVVFFLVMMSCAKPSEPSESNNSLKIEKTLSTGGYARDLSVSEEFVFVAEDTHGFSIFNHISGTRFCLVDSIDGIQIDNIPFIAGIISEELLFVYNDVGSRPISIFDVSNRFDPAYNGQIIGNSADVKKMIVMKNEFSGVDFYWTSGNIFNFGTYDSYWNTELEVEMNYDIAGFDVNNDFIAVASLQFGLTLLNRTNGEVISTTETPGEALDVKIVDNSVIIALRQEGFKIFDISDPANPQETYSKNMSDLIYTVDAQDDHLVLSSHSGGVFLYDITDISNPEFIGNLDSGDIGYTYKATLQDGKIFAATRLGIQIISF